MNTQITEQTLNDCIEKFSNEQKLLIDKLKKGDEDDKINQKELVLINNMLVSLLKLKKIRKDK